MRALPIRHICAALGEYATADCTCPDWFKRFRESDKSLEDRLRFGRLLQSHIERLKVLIKDNPSLTNHEFSAMRGMQPIHYQLILNKLINLEHDSHIN